MEDKTNGTAAHETGGKNQARISELNRKVSDIETRIAEDVAFIEKENLISDGDYNPLISGARRRIALNRNLLARYKKELRRLSETGIKKQIHPDRKNVAGSKEQ